MTDYKRSGVKAVLEDNLTLKVPKGKKTKKKKSRSKGTLAQQPIEIGV